MLVSSFYGPGRRGGEGETGAGRRLRSMEKVGIVSQKFTNTTMAWMALGKSALREEMC